ncbi:hypothetical protein [Butyrivibrio fibrisolvens]|uniref:Uncharacterized protein n=1 Tax=Butyrivibrio fibrisolvens TaxID=831 RepID=A0A317G7L5_BUTFI|nr:hypothetical protein [Butyrivibrio fibrisolvens]PWT28292.1 hypothetical protein CPT75_14775 [Butyrivibrio fibrisolvens]
MSALNIQGTSSYQMQLQSYSSKINELRKKDDSSSISLASSLKQQYTSVQSNLASVVSSNNAYVINKINEKKLLDNYIYNKKAQKEQIASSSFEASV